MQDVLLGGTADTSVPGATLKIDQNEGIATLQAGEKSLRVQVYPKPFLLTVELKKGIEVMRMNSRNLLKWEILKNKGAPGALEDITGDNDGLWEESFGAHRDSKPNGPTSVCVCVICWFTIMLVRF